MKKKEIIVFLQSTIIIIGILVSVTPAQSVDFGGDVTLASTYIWRGVKQFEGTSLQGTVEGSYGFLTLGLWYSSVNFGSSTLMETDPYISLNFPIGPIGCSLGTTYYTYDFEKFNDDADGEFELFGSFEFGALDFSGYYILKQSSTKNDPNESSYWIELSGAKMIKMVNLSLMLEYGTYSSRFISEPSKDPTGDVVISASKTLTDAVNLVWNLSFPMDSKLTRNYWLTVSYGF